VFCLESHGIFGSVADDPDGSHQQAILPLPSFRPSLIDWGEEADDKD